MLILSLFSLHLSISHTCNLFATDFIAADWRSLRPKCQYLEWVYDRRLTCDRSCNLSAIDRQLLTARTAIDLRSVETSQRLVVEWSVTGCNWAVTGRWLTVDRFSIKTKAYKKDAFHNRIISLQVFKMLTSGQLQLLRLQRVNQNAAIVATMVYRRLIRRRRRQYWLRPWIARRSLFLKLSRTIFNSRSELFQHLLRNDAVMRRQIGDVCKPIAEWLAHAWKSLCNWSPTSRR